MKIQQNKGQKLGKKKKIILFTRDRLSPFNHGDSMKW